MILASNICAVLMSAAVFSSFLGSVSSAAQYITYDKQSSTLCNPQTACKGVDMRQIPFIFDHVTEDFAKTQEFFDTERTSLCLSNKRLVLLGDSTMIEFANDLAILLSGMASDKDALEKYLFRTTRVSAGYAHYDLPNHVSEDYFGNHRNMTIYSKQLNSYIRMRYIGHSNLNKEDMGVKSLLEKRCVSVLFVMYYCYYHILNAAISLILIHLYDNNLKFPARAHVPSRIQRMSCSRLCHYQQWIS